GLPIENERFRLPCSSERGRVRCRWDRRWSRSRLAATGAGAHEGCGDQGQCSPEKEVWRAAVRQKVLESKGPSLCVRETVRGAARTWSTSRAHWDALFFAIGGRQWFGMVF